MNRSVRQPQYQLLTGREDVVETVEEAVLALARGTGGCLVVTGDEGFGKTRLLDHAAHVADERPTSVAKGTATALDRLAPLSTLTTALSGCEATREVLAGLSDAAPAVLLERLRSRLEAVSRTGPLLIVIDDVHRADELTVLALRVLVPALVGAPVLWLLSAARLELSGPVAEAVDTLLAGAARAVELPSLSAEGVGDLCVQFLGCTPDAELLALLDRAGGHPFLVEELLRTLDDDGRLQRVDGRAELLDGDGGELPTDFVEAVRRQLGGLSDEARQVLAAAAVLGRPCSIHEAAGLIDRPVRELVPGVVEAVDVGTLVETEDGLIFRHDLTAEAVYRGLSLTVRRAMHREAADVVAAEGRSAAEVAQHLVRGHEPSPERTAAALRAAVAELGTTSPRLAAELTTDLIDLLDTIDEPTAEAVAEAMRHLVAAGRTDAARSLGERALPHAPDAAAGGAVLHAMTTVLSRTDDTHAVVEQTRRLLEHRGVNEGIQADLLGEQAFALAHSSDPTAAAGPARLAMDLGRDRDRPAAITLGSIAAAVAARGRGDLSAARDHARQAVQVFDAVGRPTAGRPPRLWLAPALTALDRFGEAGAELDQCARELEHCPVAEAHGLLALRRAELLLSAGRVDAAAEAAAAPLPLDGDGPEPVVVPLLATLSEIEIRRNRIDEAGELLRRAVALDDGFAHPSAHLEWRKALLEDARGHRATAVRTAIASYAAIPDVTSLATGCPAAAGTLVRLAMHGGAVVDARRAAATMADLAERNPEVTSLAAAAAHTAALVSSDLDELHRATELFRHSPRPLPRASALEDTGIAEADRGAVAAGRSLLEEAEQTWADAGAVRDAHRVRDRLARLPQPRAGGSGEVPAPVGDAPTDPEGGPWADLTPSELRVVQLVARGMTNREVASYLVVSPHTVDTHLRRSFAKLEVTSRVELTRLFLVGDDEHAPGNPVKT